MSDVRDVLESSIGATHTIERELGGGGMSRVFVAEEKALGRKVVVKTLPLEMAAGVSIERFKREIMLAARLQHPHIAPVIAAGDADGIPYFTMPLIDGESLRQRLSRSAVPLDEAIDILRDVAQALECAHAQGVVHRDIKPENILLSRGAAVVTDFGIARAISAASDVESGSTLTALGTIVGTPAYMAPEQAAGDPVDARADLYSWGVIAYEMLAGAHPFARHTSAQALLAAHIAETPVPLAQRRADLAPSLSALVDRCLAKNPNDRPAGASAILAQLATASRVHGNARHWRRVLPLYVAATAAVLLLAAWGLLRAQRRLWAREKAVPEATRLISADLSLAAFRILDKAKAIIPADTQVARLIAARSTVASITSSPPGATVAIQDYLTPDSAWYTLGTTPLSNVRVPTGYFRWRVSKPGLGEDIVARSSRGKMTFALDSAVSAPKGMVFVRRHTWGDFIAFMGWVGPFELPSFYIDRFEVTNREYQRFVDNGGYDQPRYWQEKFNQNGRELTWDEATSLFRDRTGRPGPSTWQGGHYPDGKGDYPVSGVSWYEAAAYAEFAGKSLPAFAQWYSAAPTDGGRYIARASNISRNALAAVGTFKGLGPAGTYDMAGSVREWTRNALDDDRRFILGGSWRSQSYLYADPEALTPFDRSAENGIRCVKNVVPLRPEVYRPVKPLDRDFSKVRPASDEVFRAYAVMYDYDRSSLNAAIDGVVQETADWRKEKVSFDTPYGERMTAYLFLPKNVRPPYQSVVFFPSARVLDLTDSHTLGDTAFFDYVVQSGRAVMYPVYQGTYERQFTHTLPGASQVLALTVQRSKDVRRSIDYLETRPDIAKDKLAYMGVSMGAAEGVIYATLAQDRLRAVVFLDGGFFLDKATAGGDQADFAPRLKKPVLMVNGRYDISFSLQRAQEPLFRMLGTPEADKQRVVFETPHDVTADRAALVPAVLGFLDRYLGRVR